MAQDPSAGVTREPCGAPSALRGGRDRRGAPVQPQDCSYLNLGSLNVTEGPPLNVTWKYLAATKFIIQLACSPDGSPSAHACSTELQGMDGVTRKLEHEPPMYMNALSLMNKVDISRAFQEADGCTRGPFSQGLNLSVWAPLWKH